MVLLGWLLGAAAGEPRFPEVVTHDLLDEERTLPQDLPERYTVVLIAFFHRQQGDVDTWLPTLRRLEGARPDLGLVEIPVVSGVWKAMDDQVQAWMKAGIPDPADRRGTLPYYGDPDRFLDPLGLDGTDQIVVTVVSRDGRVWWLARGPATPEKVRALRVALDQAR
jgi:hypothetical protein